MRHQRQRFLDARAPHQRIAAGVEEGEHHQALSLGEKEHRIGKSAHADTADVEEHAGKALGIGCGGADRDLDEHGEVGTQPSAARLVPLHRFLQIALRGATEDDAASQPFRHCSSDVFTSSHDTTSSGWAS